ncbi:MAG TPA: site-specific DNA-methyltransferase [Gammaproteobacteria bacterium]|nr:site-specific DNA-methyltransferase [Gammaproteobacteria bacterium]
MATILTGDMRERLVEIADDSIDAIVCDPPYHLTQASRGGHARTNNPEMPHGRHRIGWPANVLHDGSAEVVAAFPDSDGQLARSSSSRKTQHVFGPMARGNEDEQHDPRGDSGSAARFFWCPKASRADRNEGLEGMPKKPVNWSSGDESPGTFQSEGTEREQQNFHPTVKPTELMQYLCRLVAPRGAMILDPFMGSGSTGKGAVLEGMDFIGIEIDAEYADIAERRIEARDRLFTTVERA